MNLSNWWIQTSGVNLSSEGKKFQKFKLLKLTLEVGTAYTASRLPLSWGALLRLQWTCD